MRKIFAESVEIMNNDARENGYKGNETFTVKIKFRVFRQLIKRK